MYTKSQLYNIRRTFALHSPRPEGYGIPSAVLVPLIDINGSLNVLLTQRSLHMNHQPGDVCFPGGHGESNETPVETALRETWEEIGIEAKDITIIGECDFITTHFGVYIKPFIGIVENITIDDLIFSPDEVEKVLLIPLDFFMETTPRLSVVTLEPMFPPDFPFHLIQGGERYRWGKSKIKYWFYDYNGEIIWGLTARIINNMKCILK
jgi:NTP pyrophosphohydrolases including oxidative damage repair enzymes